MKQLLKLTLLLLTFLLPATATAHDFEVDGIYYELDDNDNAVVTYLWSPLSGIEYSGNVIIPQTVTYGHKSYNVTAIGDNAFGACKELMSIKIPNSITTIGQYAFGGCSRLTSITIPNSVTSIGSNAFSNCSELTTISVDSGNTTYDSRDSCNAIIETATNTLIVGCNNTVIPSSVTIINNGAFNGCSRLTSINIPDAVTSIGNSVFLNCSALTSIHLPDAVTSIGNSAFANCFRLTNINIPDAVTTIGNSAFSNCSSLTSIIIPNAVAFIGNGAFLNCSGLTQIVIESGNPKYDSRNNSNSIIETASNTLIIGCKNTVIPNTVTNIGNKAFLNCSELTNVNIPNSVTSISNNAFEGCKGLTRIVVESENPKYDSRNNCNAIIETTSNTLIIGCKNTVIPNSVTNIGISAFTGSGITCITIPASITSISNKMFSGCELSNIVVESGNPKYDSRDNCNAIIETASNTLVLGCKNTVIPNSVTSISEYAFEGLTSITIPTSITAISYNTFYDCDLNNIVVESGNPIYDSRDNCNAIIETASNTLVVGCKNTVIPNSVTAIGIGAFCRCNGLTNIEIPNSVTLIGGGAFSSCSGLTRIKIGNSVSFIDDDAFEFCNGLACVNITDIAAWCNIVFSTRLSNPLCIAKHLYLNDSEITELIIPNSVTHINENAFRYCIGLTSVSIPSTVNDMGINTFVGCTGLKTLIYNPISCNYLDEPDYDYFPPFFYTNIPNIIIGDSVERIPNYFAWNMTTLSCITIPKSVKKIGSFAFSGCNGLDNVFSHITNPKEVYLGQNIFECYLYSSIDYSNRTLHVPFGTSEAYQSDNRWSAYFGTIVEMDPVAVATIELDKEAAVLAEGETLKLTATVLPEDAYDKTVTWATSNPEVARVDSEGLVTAVSIGTATITAMTADGSNLSASCAVTVRSLSASECLTMDNLSVFHGDTIVIPVKMVNEASIISFQTDIYLPEGLELLQEDGEYIIDPSSRMTSTHNLMSNAVSNGSIRVVCYSANYKPFKGESGDDLFYITVKVADDAEGDYTVRLKNTLFTTNEFEEIAVPDAAAIVNVKAYIPGDANDSGNVTVTDVVVTSQYILEMNPEPFNFTAADVNTDGSITVTDVSRIAWIVLNPTLNAPLRAPALWNNGDLMSGNGITLAAGETRRVSIALDNAVDYNAFQFDLRLPAGLTASNFAVTDRAASHAFDVNTLKNGDIRVLCYSPILTAISGHEGALLTFDVTATAAVNDNITVDGIELVTTGCQTVKLDAFAIGVNAATTVNETAIDKDIANIEYFNLAGQRITEPTTGVSLVVATYTDGTRTTTKLIK